VLCSTSRISSPRTQCPPHETASASGLGVGLWAHACLPLLTRSLTSRRAEGARSRRGQPSVRRTAILAEVPPALRRCAGWSPGARPARGDPHPPRPSDRRRGHTPASAALASLRSRDRAQPQPAGGIEQVMGPCGTLVRGPSSRGVRAAAPAVRDSTPVGRERCHPRHLSRRRWRHHARVGREPHPVCHTSSHADDHPALQRGPPGSSTRSYGPRRW
jgi:hypothetical protein